MFVADRHRAASPAAGGNREERRARITCAANDSAPVPRGKLAVVVLAAPGHGGVAVAVAVAAGAAE